MSVPLPVPIGNLVDVGGHRMHVFCAGAGAPTVVFEAGGGSWSLDWTLVQTEVAKFTATCSYDRAGFGWSEAGPRPRTSERMVDELQALLANAGIAKPYILVGASFGGHIVRLYAKRYPEEVAGVVLIDARHESIDARMPPSWRKQEITGKRMFRFLLLASRLKLLPILGRVMGGRGLPPIVMKLPEELRRVYLAVGFQPKYFQANLDELEACATSDRQLAAAGSLGDLPLVVIRHGVPDLFARMPAAEAAQAEQTWQKLQAELSELSSNGRLLVAELSGHAVQVEQPEVVVDAIRTLVTSRT